jgi:hypothetical protein
MARVKDRVLASATKLQDLAALRETKAVTGLRKDGTNPRALGTNPRATTVAAKVATVTKVATKPVPQGRAETAAEKAANATTGGLVPIKKSALSLDVGPRVIHAMFSGDTRVNELTQEIRGLKSKQYMQLAELTTAVWKAAKADSNIDLTAAYSGDTKQMGKLNNQLGIALGFREVRLGEPDKTGVVYESVVTSKSVGDCFPLPGETEKNSPNYLRKRTFQTNFMTQLKKCAQSAHAALVTGMEVKVDAKAGTLMIAGPAVKKHYGQDRVLLNEKKTVGEGDAKVELSEKPSFTSLANIGGATLGVQPAEGAGGAHHRGKQPGTVGGTLVVQAVDAVKATGKETTDQAIVTICKMLQQAIDKTKDLSKAAIVALEEIQNAIEVKLAN